MNFILILPVHEFTKTITKYYWLTLHHTILKIKRNTDMAMIMNKMLLEYPLNEIVKKKGNTALFVLSFNE